MACNLFMERHFNGFAAKRLKTPSAASRNQSEDGESKMEDGKGRSDVRGMIVRGIMLETSFLIPLPIIPLTLDSSRKVADRKSSWNCMILHYCTS